MTKLATRIAVLCALAAALVGCAPTPAAQQAGTPTATAIATETEAATATAIETETATATAVDESAQQNDALDAYVAAERATIPAIKEASPGIYSEVSVKSVYPSTVDYHYVYAKQLDATAASAYFDTQMPTLQTACDTQVFPAMLNAGVGGPPKVTYTFDNADGSQLWSHTFEQS